MSKSRHVTHKTVFRGKPKSEIKRMIAENDLDVELLREKKHLKKQSVKKRKGPNKKP